MERIIGVNPVTEALLNKEKNIENFNSLNDLKEDYKNIFDLELVDKKYLKYMDELKNVLTQKNYIELSLKVIILG